MNAASLDSILYFKPSPLRGVIIAHTVLGFSLIFVSSVYLHDLVQNFPLRVKATADENNHSTSFTNIDHQTYDIFTTNQTNSSSEFVESNDHNFKCKVWVTCSSFCILLGFIQFSYNAYNALKIQTMESKWVIWCGVHGILLLCLVISFTVALLNHGLASNVGDSSSQRKAIGFYTVTCVDLVLVFISISYVYFTIGFAAIDKGMSQMFGIKSRPI